MDEPAKRNRILIALGGNAMIGPGGDASVAAQQAAVTRAVAGVAGLVRAGHEVVLTHGNGPQVGNLLTKNELSAHEVPPVPLDWCVAQTQATIGFTIQNALEDALRQVGCDRRTATVVTRTVVDADDPGFGSPSKPIGRHLPRAEAERFIEMGQTWQDRGAKGWRRVVASPEPRRVVDAAAVSDLLHAGYVVVAAGGGGIPVVADGDGWRGVEAVIDKDLTAAILGRELEADVLVIATDVDHVMVRFGDPDQEAITRTTPERLRELAAEFSAGSMGPKAEAAARFVDAGGIRAVISSLDHIVDAAAGAFGTVVTSQS
ncbi:MAG: carbamate kinase [Geodermatophilaceae bacterium]|jgi:carbamate kinase|nr:carbamate kinase [Geodermatophilaceae bacterium]